MRPLRIAFAGTPEFAVPALTALIGSPHRVVGVLTQPDRPKGRGRQLAPGPVKLTAQRYGLPLSQPASLRSERDRSDLRLWLPDLLVVVAYGLILPAEALAIPALGCVNVHASILPRWRGAAPVQRAILAGDTTTGVTIMRMDAGLDTGPIVLQRTIEIAPRDTADTLQGRLAAAGAGALLEALPFIHDPRRSRPQAGDGITYAAKISKSEARIDWSRDASAIDRQIRAFNPRPIAQTTLNGEPLKIYAAYPLDMGPHSKPLRDAMHPKARPVISGPGTIAAVRTDGLEVLCGSGRLVLTEVQRPGRRKVSGRELGSSETLTGRSLG